MSKNPVVNSLAALAYIFLVVSVMNYGGKTIDDGSLMAPVAFISLFTLSAAVMGYLFCYQPIQLYFENKKKSAVRLFLQTVTIFGGITALILMLLFLGVL